MGGNLRDPSASDKAAIAISPITSSISILSSLTLVYIIVSDREVKLKKPNNRFLLVMSIFDIIHSLAFAVIALPLPIDSGIYGARGNHWTCAIQGFMVQIGATVPCYNACICVWSWVHIKYNIHPDLFKEKIEPYCHALSIGAPLLLAIFNAAVDLYGPRGFYCWVIIEKTLKSKIATGAGIAIYFISGTIMGYCLIRIYHLFLQQEQQMRRYSTSPSGMQWRPNPVVTSKRAAAKQGLLYTLAFVITYFFAFLNVAVLDNAHGDTTVFGLLQAVFMPLQGFWNFIIFSRPTIERIRREYPENSFLSALHKMIFHPAQVRPRITRRRSSLTSNRQVMGRSRPSENLDRRNSTNSLFNSGARDEFKAHSRMRNSLQDDIELAVDQLRKDGLVISENSDDNDVENDNGDDDRNNDDNDGDRSSAGETNYPLLLA